MAEYHVGCGCFGIYAGVLNPRNKELWKNESEVTGETINAVRDYMILELLGGMDCTKAKTGAYEWDGSKGTIELRITIKKD